MPLLANDDVVMHRNAERLRHLDDLPGHLDVGAGRARVAGGVVVDQDHRGRREFERALDDLAGVDRGVVDGADLLDLVGDELVALVEEQDAELLLMINLCSYNNDMSVADTNLVSS
jgi:hypothetical protein